MNLLIVNASVREGRASGQVTAWVENIAKDALPDVQWQTADLKEIGLPMFDEPISPMFNKERTPEGPVKVWLDALREADGYVFITPEYNHSMPSGLKNAIDFIAYEVMKKPFMAVGHGGTGGARAIDNLKTALNANIGAVPIANSVTLLGYPGMGQVFDESGELLETHRHQAGELRKALETLVWYADALKTKRETQA